MNSGEASRARVGGVEHDRIAGEFLSEVTRSQSVTDDKANAETEFMRLAQYPQLLHVYINKIAGRALPAVSELNWRDAVARSTAGRATVLSRSDHQKQWGASARFEPGLTSGKSRDGNGSPFFEAFVTTGEECDVTIDADGLDNNGHERTIGSGSLSRRQLSVAGVFRAILRMIGLGADRDGNLTN